MKHVYLKLGALATLLTLQFGAAAQSPTPCLYDDLRVKALQEDPVFVQQEADKMAFIKKYIASGNAEKDNDVYIIPVVFHIVHQYGPENITDEQILDQMRILNRDFRALNADTSEVVDEFKQLIGDVKIEFRLATIDPVGNCTNGIERLVSAETYIGSDGARFNAWDKNRYMNIWVCNVLPGAAGYVTGLDVAMAHSYTGSIGTSGEYGSRALTHEVGHWLSLPHIWGLTAPATECGDEGVDDTPITKGFSPGSIPCVSKQRVCDVNIVENHQNYMDYAYCQRMFTLGQVTRMRGVAANTQNAQGKMALPSNLANTGVDGVANMLCSPIAAFYANKDIACLNVPVTFRDNSTRGFVESRSWTFQDATPATSTDQVPVVRFNTAGWKTVTLIVTNAQGSDTITKTKAIFISNASVAESVPYFESFTDASVIGDKWLVKNFEENQTSFTQAVNAGYSDQNSMKLNAFNSPGGKTLKDGNGDIDALYSPAFNMSGKTGWQISFKIASACKTSNTNNMTEKMKIEYSSSCGTSWVLLQEFTKAQLNVSGYSGSNYTPNNANAWKELTFPVTASLAKDNMRFKITYTSSQYSNNFYMDDFKIAPTNGIDVNAAQLANVELYPNPVTEQTTLTYSLINDSEVSFTISDITGKTIAGRKLGTQQSGVQSLTLQNYTQQLQTGVYFITLNIGNSAVTKKLIVG